MLAGAEFDDGDAARSDCKGSAVQTILLLHFELFVVNPFGRALDLLGAQADGRRHSGAAIDLGQALLLLEDTVVVEECNHPTSRVAID